LREIEITSYQIFMVWRLPYGGQGMNIHYRLAKPGDIAAVAQVYSTAVNDLYERHGLGDQIRQVIQPNPYYAFCLREEPDGFWVAENETEIVGMAISWLRGSFWFLGCLFIVPTCQESGIGRKLLDKTLELGSHLNVTNHALITFPFNRVSTALYMRYGMYPREPIYRMVGDGTVARSVHKETESFNYEKLPPERASIQQLCSIDEPVLGIPLERHHEYFLNAHRATCYIFRRKKNPEGYAYVWSNGHVGPLAVVSSNSLRGVMNTALGLAAVPGTPQVSVMIPGSNDQAVAVALDHKLRIAIPFLLMSSQHFGNWDNYLFYSPALM
jgi:ribosomal protein S18 acetylase RimI-like enzyme